MNFTAKVLQQRRRLPAISWMLSGWLLLAFLFVAQSVAAAPSSNITISNIAKAIYDDDRGISRTTLSNEVVAFVQQVGSFTLDGFNKPETTVVNTGAGLGGDTVYAPHVLINTGNGPDSFSLKVTEDTPVRLARIEIFPDADGDGKPDAGAKALCSAVPDAACDVAAQAVEAGGRLKFVVAYTLPASVTGEKPFTKTTITATPSTIALYTAPNTSAADKDQVNALANSLLRLGKAIGTPNVAPPSGGKWPSAPSTGPRSTSPACPTTWVAAQTAGAGCQYTVYTLTVENLGDAPARFALSDPIPAGLTYVSGSAVWSGAPAVALGEGTGGDPKGIDFQLINGNTVNAVVSSVGARETQTLNFVVLVNTLARVDASNTTNVAYFQSTPVEDTVTAINIVKPPVPTPPVPYKVIDTLVDLTNSPQGKGQGNVADGDLGAGPSPEPTTVNTAAAGTTTAFSLFVKNFDAKPNNYNLAGSESIPFLGNLPAGWAVKFVDADGDCAAGPALNSLVVPAGQQRGVKACVVLSATAKVEDKRKIYFRAMSLDGRAIDIKTDAVTVTGAKTLVTTNVTLTPEHSDVVLPGGYIDYAHTLSNTGKQSCGAYTFTATDAQAGWTTVVYLDANGNGLIDADEQPLRGKVPAPLQAGASQKLMVRVSAPGGAAAGTVDVSRLVVTFDPLDGGTACADAGVIDTTTVIAPSVTVSKVQALDADCDGKVDANASYSAQPLQVRPGQCIVYQVVATNTGTRDVSRIHVEDSMPPGASFSSRQPSGTDQCASSGVNPAAVSQIVNPNTLRCGGGAASVMSPNGSVTLTFAVKVR